MTEIPANKFVLGIKQFTFMLSPLNKFKLNVFGSNYAGFICL